MIKWRKENEATPVRGLLWGESGGRRRQPARQRISTGEEVDRHEDEVDFWRMGRMSLNAEELNESMSSLST